MEIKVTKITDIDLLHKCAEYTTGKDCNMSLATAYRNHHSIIRSQIFFIELRNIPLFAASQFVRSHVGVQFFQRSKRTDRGGEDFNQVCRDIAFDIRTKFIGKEDVPIKGLGGEYNELAEQVETLPDRFDRHAPTDLAFIINAEAIINMSHKRLCSKASRETGKIWIEVCNAIRDIDPDLYRHLVPMCIFRGEICGEPKSCGFNKTNIFKKELDAYKLLFV